MYSLNTAIIKFKYENIITYAGTLDFFFKENVILIEEKSVGMYFKIYSLKMRGYNHFKITIIGF